MIQAVAADHHEPNPADAGHGEPAPNVVHVRVLRQDAPGEESYWERHAVPYEPNMNVISILQRIAAVARSADGRQVAPVAWDCNCLEEVCGSCTMLVNGRTRMACTALVDKLLEENAEEIELKPMSKFPVVRDLVVDRGRLFRSLERVKAWVPVDGSYDHGPGPRISPEEQEDAYPLSTCISCGCCLEACPQFGLEADASKWEESLQGAQVWSQVRLFNMQPIGATLAGDRLDAVMGEGGIADCGNAQN